MIEPLTFKKFQGGLSTCGHVTELVDGLELLSSQGGVFPA